MDRFTRSIFQLLLLAVVSNSSNAETGQDEKTFSQKLYLGGSVGLTRLTTDFANGRREIVDGAVASGSLFTGYDISPYLAIEASASTTDSAAVSQNQVVIGDLGYRNYAISAIGYLYTPQLSHQGASVFTRLGVGFKEYDSRLAVKDSTSTHVVFGLGSEYGWQNGMGARAELSLLDDDAQQLNFSLLKRFDLELMPQQIATGSLEVAKSKLWTNRLFLSLPTIYFEDNDPRSPLTKREQKRLDELAQQLLKNPELRIEVRGHSDADTSLRDNLILSRRRAITVSRYLQSKGVRGNQLHIRSYGNSKPMKNPVDLPGKGSGRRVDFEIYHKKG